ncbi:hypothetical protein JX265_000877 [Neoarthrinium moseri]|uniref:Uncharacterized protein n=1 Tax=Neoarthrinium moseri TaxID=1658444 RepID=A0A9P9WWM8_9PEZI|nr:uncharacterized protein JN550_007017 [Neoarthrinium moseri]KAI1847639.1 hypothetical protein JX266_006491 [Neoarthrinium moseri]KAI1867286.1 hypothetical protein JN550_007017 [Neoarthrinium moseri]KAI1880637.1 hypothetical protein JX265_000877 [Neoarthrinium moseri]
MSSVIRSSLRQSSRAAQQLARGAGARSYSSANPPPAQGGANRTLILGLVAVTVPAVYLLSTRNAKAQEKPAAEKTHAPPQVHPDPAERARLAKEKLAANDGKVKYEHPEHLEPDKYKPAFGRVHERKRVDGPPDGRNHQELHDRQKHL